MLRASAGLDAPKSSCVPETCVLRARVFSAVVGIGAVLLAVFALDSRGFAVAAALVMVAGAWEWAALLGWRGTARVGYLAWILAGIGGAGWLLTQGRGLPLFVAAALWWVAALVLLARWDPQRPVGRWTLALAGFLGLVPAWAALVWLHLLGPMWLMYLFGLVWVADSAAYFIGRSFGRRRLAPALSPGKTLEGLWGALAVVAAYAGLVAWWLRFGAVDGVYFVLLGLLAAMVSVEGDLVESMLKRRSGAKDSGRLIPGHGGALDRIDSLLAAAPVFVLGLQGLSRPLP
ncbi:MAG TPA: phosphatidate cytidylyltransferase [Chromatiales bacterium]|nr:phosphatidate cytidylyltransferase [Chromatiales bacterium]